MNIKKATDQKILFIHSAGAQGSHQGSSRLVAYLQETLGAEYHVLSPQMPDPENPKWTTWKAQLEKEFSTLDGDVILIGHSLGGSVLLKYLSEETCRRSISALFLIAAPCWGKYPDWQSKEYTLSENFASKLPPISSIFLYHSYNDGIVPFAHLQYYAEQLPQAITRVLQGDEHSFRDGLPKLIEDLRRRERRQL